MTPQELLNRYRRGEVDFKGQNLSRINLAGLDLIGSEMADTDLRAANLVLTFLNRVNLHKARLSGASHFGDE
ncbi:MAG: pentapeptide repeat-containing protein [Prochlorothrix sp.]